MSEGAYVDACIFIHLFQKRAGAVLDACNDLVERAKKKTLVIITSTWTLTEVNKIDKDEKDPGILEHQSKLILGFFQNKFIELKQLTRQIAELAHNLTRTHGLTNADAVHVATAIVHSVPVLYTYDDPKKKRKGLLRHSLKIGGNPLLRIEKPPVPPPPPDPAEGTLFDKARLKPDEGENNGAGVTPIP